MNKPRFIQTEMGLILETPIPLSFEQRNAVRLYAMKEYTRRVRMVPAGKRRDALYKVIQSLNDNNFIERAIPLYDFDREVILHGKFVDAKRTR